MSTEDAAALLAAARADAVQRIAALRGDVTSIVDSASSTTGDDEHDPEGATIGFERAQAMALLAQAEAQLGAVDAALNRLAAGNYGICESCDRAIAAERLAARPEATRCITCAARR
ncbi:MAG TPA: TraR/DksA C4-type zinc finger protein [Jatrophihabitantaceae bacterium]